MVYFVGLGTELKQIQQKVESAIVFVQIDDLNLIDDWEKVDLLLIGSSVENPIRLVQQIVSKDDLITIIIFSSPARYNQVKQSLQFSLSVGKNTTCVIFNPAISYGITIETAVSKTKQKRGFKRLNFSEDTKLSQLSSTPIKLDNLGSILENAPIGAMLVNADLIVIGVNKAAREMYTQLNGTKISIEKLFTAKDVEQIRQAIHHEKVTSMAIEDLYGNCYEISGSRVANEGSENTILLINDVTEKLLKDKRVTAILESLPQIAWTTDPAGNTTYLNQGWYTFTNRTFDEGMGSGWVSIVHPDDSELQLKKWKESINTGVQFQNMVRLKRFDGEYRWHVARAVPVWTRMRNIEMWVGTAADINDQVLQNEKLEFKVNERTKLLEETNAELEQFVHISSHDLQEPLRKIQTYANMVKDEGTDQLPESIIRYVDKIISTSARMSKLLKDLLSFSKIDQREDELLVNLNEVVGQIREDLELVIVQSGATIVSENLPTVMGRPTQLKQLFYNLISNGIKYRTQEPPQLKITANMLSTDTRVSQTTLPEGGYWEVTVKDNGIGFDQRHAQQIFAVFQRLHTRNAYEGTGIGLAIAKKVVSNHKGDIFAISKLGVGSEFHVVIPNQYSPPAI